MPEHLEQLKMQVLNQDGLIIAKYSGTLMQRNEKNANRFQGHLMRWHSPDRFDLTGEWFSRNTNRMLKAGYPIIGIPTNFQHGLYKDANTGREFGAMGIGLLDFTDEDEIGQFVEGVLFEREQYLEMLHEIGRTKGLKVSDSQYNQKAELAVKAVNTLLTKAPMQFSGGYDPVTWVVNPDTKHIDQAGAIHLAFTPTPADDLNPIVSFKSMMNAALDLEHERKTYDMSPNSIQTDTQPTAHKEASPKDANGSKSDVVDSNKEIEISIENKPNEDKMNIQEFLANLVAQLQAFLGEQGMPESEAVAMAGDVAEEVKADMPEEEMAKAMPEEEVMKRMEKAFTILTAKMEQKNQARAKFQQAFSNKANSLVNAPAPASNYLGASNAANTQKAANIQVVSKYANWTAEDFSYAADIINMSQTSGRKMASRVLDQAFYREFADTAIKQHQNGQIRLTHDAIKGIYAIKSDELNYSTQSGFGDEWVPTVWSDSVWDKPRINNIVQNVFEAIDMPSNPYEYPVEAADPTVYYVEETQDSASLSLDATSPALLRSKVATRKITFDAKKHALNIGISNELTEDGIGRLVPKFREQAERAILDALDYAVLNGDTTAANNINNDGATLTGTGLNNRYVAYDGLIHQALITASSNAIDLGGAAPTLAHIRQARFTKLGNNISPVPQDLVIICDAATYGKLLSMNEVVTVDKFGGQATVLTGTLGIADGIPVHVSAQMPLADTDGKVTNGGNVANTGRLIIVHRPSWKLGYRRRVTQSMTFLPYFDEWEMVITVRTDWKGRTYSGTAQQSTDDTVALLYNIGI